jgi:hypothetical protein
MSEAPETIWARRHETGVVEAADYKIEGEQEYRRTDLAATDEQAFANEKVKALVEALRKTVRALGEMTDDDWMGEIDHHAVMLTLHKARATLAEPQDG